MSTRNRVPQFGLGITLATPDAMAALEAADVEAFTILRRHVLLEQGELCDEDHRLNRSALKDGSRIFSSFKLPTGVIVWVITTAKDDSGHRESTTILLPENY